MRPQAEIEARAVARIVASPYQNARPLARGPYINSTAEKRPYIGTYLGSQRHTEASERTPGDRTLADPVAGWCSVRWPIGGALSTPITGLPRRWKNVDSVRDAWRYASRLLHSAASCSPSGVAPQLRTVALPCALLSAAIAALCTEATPVPGHAHRALVRGQLRAACDMRPINFRSIRRVCIGRSCRWTNYISAPRNTRVACARSRKIACCIAGFAEPVQSLQSAARTTTEQARPPAQND
jgi:hypothetical protein